jgi:hypothetical protein
MIDPKKHSENRGVIESFLRYIPGFRGYLEKDYRQESDFLARKWMADRLQKCKPPFDEYVVGLVDAGQIDALTNCDRLKTRLDGLILRLRGAVRGYSGFFDYVRVDLNLLDEVYEFDMALMQDVDSLAHSIEQLASKPDSSPAAVQELLGRVSELSQRFDRRGELLNGLGQL